VAWRIEQAKTGRSSCRQCGQQIAQGEHRFGNDASTVQTAWYHLACAAAGKPRAFKPFAKQAAPLMAKMPKPKPKQAATRNPELEARLVANPEDEETRGVFADWLQGNGDPWGEIIALELAGNETAAKKLFKQHATTLSGGFAPRMLEWEKGFIRSVVIERKARSGHQAMLEKLLDVPATILVRSISIPINIDAAFVAFLNQRLSPAVKKLFTRLTNAVAGLALPHLEELGLWFEDGEVSVEGLAPLFAATELPKLKRFSIYNQPIPIPILTAFIDSKLLRQLECLQLTQGALDAAGVELLKKRKDALEHLAAMRVDGLIDLFRKQYEAWVAQANQR
jgi:uncharacterized protein (TIGR02996 family)